MSKDNKYPEEFATGMGATVGGIILTPVAGLIGTVIGAGIGGSTTLILVKNLDWLTDLPKRLQTALAIRRLIRGKLDTDFDDSYLSSTSLAEWALNDARKIVDPKDDRKDERFEWEWAGGTTVQKDALSNEEVREKLKVFRKGKPIKVSCTVISAATVAVLKSLQVRYGDQEKYGDSALKL